jgi:hypothetical protein
MDIHLPLKSNWFKLTKKRIKLEDYRDLTPRYCAMFLLLDGEKRSMRFWESLFLYKDPKLILNTFTNITFKKFDQNIMTLGYPKKEDFERILKLEHKGIEIRNGNVEWGAEPDKLYFVIKHGDIIL